MQRRRSRHRWPPRRRPAPSSRSSSSLLLLREKGRRGRGGKSSLLFSSDGLSERNKMGDRGGGAPCVSVSFGRVRLGRVGAPVGWGPGISVSGLIGYLGLAGGVRQDTRTRPSVALHVGLTSRSHLPQTAGYYSYSFLLLVGCTYGRVRIVMLRKNDQIKF